MKNLNLTWAVPLVMGLALPLHALDMNAARLRLASPNADERRGLVQEISRPGDAEAVPLLIEALSDSDPLVQTAAAQGLGAVGVVDYAALGALRRVSGDFQAETDVRVAALSAYLVLQPTDLSSTGDLIRLAADARSPVALSGVDRVVNAQGDAAVGEIRRALDSRVISWDLADRWLGAIGTQLAAQERNQIRAEADHGEPKLNRAGSHRLVAPNVTTPGWQRHEVK